MTYYHQYYRFLEDQDVMEENDLAILTNGKLEKIPLDIVGKKYRCSVTHIGVRILRPVNFSNIIERFDQI